MTVHQIGSARKMKVALALLARICRENKGKQPFATFLQKLILTRAGECVGKMADLQRQAQDMTAAQQEEFKALFLMNRQVIMEILRVNRQKVEDLQEHRMDGVKDLSAFLASPEWRDPQSLISLAGYWLSWNNYYSSLLRTPEDAPRKDLLTEAVEGFSRTLIDFDDESTIVRSLFGRALCYKALRNYGRAEKDFDLVTKQTPRGDSLHLRCRYESALVSFLAERFEIARKKLNELHEDIEKKDINADMKAAIATLQVRTRLALFEKESEKGGSRTGSDYREILQQLQMETDENRLELLCGFIKKHADAFMHLSSKELGAAGSLAMADRYFEREEYDEALARYRPLGSDSHPFVRKRLDAICFRMGFVFCHKKEWQAAMPCFESLFNEFPGSPFVGKASGLYYAAAAAIYKENPTEAAYDKYIQATKKYLESDTDADGRSEARFALGKYYQDRQQSRKACEQFYRVGSDSFNYAAARQYILAADVAELQALREKGLGRSDSARKIYQAALDHIQAYAHASIKYRNAAHRLALEANLTLLQARLHLCSPLVVFDPDEMARRKRLQHEAQLQPYKERHTIAAYREFLGKYPDSNFAILAEQRLPDIDFTRFGLEKLSRR